MTLAVLGAPGAGKSELVPHLRQLLPGHVILDWDVLMEPAGELAGTSVRDTPSTWPAYRHLVRTVLEVVAPVPVVLLGVGTPAELVGWPIERWVLLDCDDAVRRDRLEARGSHREVPEALADAREYRGLGLPVIDTSRTSVAEVAAEVANAARGG